MTAEERYHERLEAYRLIAKAHRTVTLRYRAREIDDPAYIASRASLAEATRQLDDAEMMFVREGRA